MGNATYRDSTIAGDATFTTNTITAVAPTTQAADGQVIIVGASRIAPDAAPTVSTPSGWTQSAVSSSFQHAGTLLNSRLYVFTRKAVDADSNASIVANANSAMFAVRASYSDVDPNGFFGQAVFQDGASGTSHVVNAITTARANSLIGILLTQSVAQASTPPGDMTEREDSATFGTTYADAIQAAAGSTGNKTFTAASAADFLSAFIEIYSNNPVGVVEALTFADSQAVTADFVSGQSETITLSDSQVAASNSDAEQDETLTLVDEQVATSGADAEQSETLTLIDSAVAVQASAGAQAETITLSDSAVAVAAFDSAQDESITLVDEQDATEPGQETQEEAITFLDSQIAVQDSVCAQSESITFVDLVSAQGDEPSTPFGGGFFSYAWRRKLMEDELREQLKELPDPVAEVIERQVIEAVDRPKLPSQKELRAKLEQENIPYRQAYQKAMVSLVKEMRQREADEEEEEAIATALASLV